MLGAPSNEAALSSPIIANDLRFADHLIAKALKKGSWCRNKAWAQRFGGYVLKACPGLIQRIGFFAAVKSNRIALAFLARVARERSATTTCVDAAKRAVNFLRAFAQVQPLNKDPSIKLLSRSACSRKCADRESQRYLTLLTHAQVSPQVNREDRQAKPSVPRSIRRCNQ